MLRATDKITALYCRLSVEDMNKNGGKEDESNSIQNQKMILLQYAKENRFPNPIFLVDDGYSRCSRSRWLLNVFLVWGLTGLWHGAAWNFVLWGLFFAVLLAAEKLWYGHRLEKTRLLKHLYMLPLLAVSFVLFHAADLPAAGQQIGALFGFGGLPASGVESLYYLRSYAVVLVIALLGATPLPAKAVQRLRNTSAGSAVLSVAEPVALVLLLAACTAYLVDGSFNPFLYFRF